MNAPPVRDLSVVAQPDLFSAERIRAAVPHGLNLLETLELAGVEPVRGCEICVYVDGVKVPIPDWLDYVPAPGTQITAVAMPLTGGGFGADALRVVATIAVITAAVAAGPLVIGAAGLTAGTTAATIAGAVTTAAVAAGGIYAVNALLPVADPAGESEEGPAGSTVTGQSNAIKRYAPIPLIAGGPIRVYPSHAALPYTEIEGGNVYLRMLLCVGLGPLAITDIRLGETPIGSFPPEEVEFETIEGRPTDPPLTLYTQDVFELAVNTEVRRDTGPEIRTTQANTTEITFDLFFPEGLIDQQSNGKVRNAQAFFKAELRVSPAGPWEDFEPANPTINISARTNRPFRRSYRRTGLAADQYDVRITRLTGDSDFGTNFRGRTIWTALRSINPQNPVQRDDVALIALRIKRDGPVEAINCLAQSYALQWTGAAWIEGLTNNPASLFRLVLQGPGNPDPLPDSLLDLPNLQSWYDANVAAGWAFNAVFEDTATVFQRLQQITAAGQGQLTRPNGKYAVVVDTERTTPVALISPRNSWGFQLNKPFNPSPEALRCQFVNEDEDFGQDERLVFADGKDENNVDGSRIEILDLQKRGVTDKDLVWRIGRRTIAELQLRPERYTVNQDVEQLVLTLGDLALIQHDVLLVGLGAGRVKTVTVDGGGAATSITTDELFTMETGKSYALVIRSIDTSNQDLIATRPINTVVGETNTFTFTTPIPVAEVPAPRDLVTFGEAGQETLEAVVRDIFPFGDLQAQLTLVPHGQPGIDDSETGGIPAFNSNITLPGGFFGRPPNVPVIERIVVEDIAFPGQPNVVAQVQLVVFIEPTSTAENPPEQLQIRIREQNDISWDQNELFPGDSKTLEIKPRTVDATYEVQVRAHGRTPRGIPNQSLWSPSTLVFVPEPETTISDVGRVAGLELVNQANQSEFEGSSPTFAWRFTSGPGVYHLGQTGGLIAFKDPAFGFFQVTIKNLDGLVRRVEQIQTPQYTYDFNRNFDDGRRLGEPGAARAFSFEVTIVDAFGQPSPQISRIFVQNPAPAEPVLTITNELNTIVVTAEDPADPDFAGIIVWASESSSFTPSPANEVGRARQTSLNIAGTPGTTTYLRVALFDDFGSEVSDLNLSSEFAIQIGTGVIDTFQLKENAVSKIATDALASTQIQTTIGDWLEVLSTDIETAGFDTTVRFGLHFESKITAISNPRISCEARLLRDAVVQQVYQFGLATAQDGPAEADGVVTPIFRDSALAGGEHTYSVETRIFEASGTSQQLSIFTGTTLEVQEIKR